MESAGRQDVWSAGDRYEPYVGRWSRLVAHDFVGWLALPAALDWLDVGCGTGALTRTILAVAQPRSIVGVDRSQAFVDYAKARAGDPTARFEVADAQALPLDAASVDAAVSGLVLNFVPRPEVAVAEMARVARTAGTVAAYVWDYAGGMELMRHFWDAAVALDPAAQEQDEARRFPLCREAPLAQVFSDARLHDVETHVIEVPTVFRDFDDYWTPFLGGQGPAPGYAMALDEAHRSALRECIRRNLPIAADGSIRLTARAFAVRGRR